MKPCKMASCSGTALGRSLLITGIACATFAQAQTTQNYPDATGEVAVPGSPFPHLDIASVDVTLNAAETDLTFRINLDGDPVATNWGNYMIAIRSVAGGASTGNGWGRPIDFTSGMNVWIGMWVNDGGTATGANGQLWTYSTGSWSQTGQLDSTDGTVTPDATGFVEVTIPIANLGIDTTDTLFFDVYSSGGGGGDGAVDALSAAATSIGNWPDSFTTDAIGGAPNPPLQFTMPSAPDFATWITGFGLALEDQDPGDDPDADNLTNQQEFDANLDLNPNDDDTDGDDLTDDVETGSGIYVSPSDTGTFPAVADTDGDTFNDGEEVDGTGFGYVTDPHKFNHLDIAIAASFLTPSFDPTGAGVDPLGTDALMNQVGTSLADQFTWTRQLQIKPAGNYSLKFTNALDWADMDHQQWGDGGTPNVAVSNGNDIPVPAPLTGIHTFTFNTDTLAYSIVRTTFATEAEFLTAYGNLLAGDDDDSDGLDNSEEFAAGTDPLCDDTDGDGLLDGDEDGGGVYVSASQTGTDPLNADSDGDTLIDGIENASGTFNGPNDPGTDPNKADSDGDTENDDIEIFHGTDPNDINDSRDSLGLPFIDGTKDSLYGSPVSVQTVQTQFGDNESELNAAYGTILDGKLYLLLTGNLQDNFNKLEIFIDTDETTGEDEYFSAGNDGTDALENMFFDVGFKPDFHLIARRGDGKFDLDIADLDSTDFDQYTSFLNNGTAGWGRSGTGTVNSEDILVAYDGSNSAGVTAGNGAADQTAAAAVTTGLELCIDLDDIGSPSGDIRIMAIVANNDHSFLSNQSLGGLPVDLDDPGPGTSNLGSPDGLDFSAIALDQFFVVGPPSPEPFTITSVQMVGGGTQIEIVIEGLTIGQNYTVTESSDLSAFSALSTAVAPALPFPATTTTQTVTITIPAGTKYFYRAEDAAPPAE